MSKKLTNHNLIIKFKQGLLANINAAVTKALATTGEPHYCTDEKQLYVFDGSENLRANKATYSDYSLTQTGNTPTTKAKLDMSGATLISESEDLFDIVNSRILKMPTDTVGQAVISMELNTSTGSNHWVEFELRGYDDTDTLLFTKRPSTVSLIKNNANDGVHEILEFYFGPGVEYFEIWWVASSAMPYTDPEVTIMRF